MVMYVFVLGIFVLRRKDFTKLRSWAYSKQPLLEMLL